MNFIAKAMSYIFQHKHELMIFDNLHFPISYFLSYIKAHQNQKKKMLTLHQINYCVPHLREEQRTDAEENKPQSSRQQEITKIRQKSPQKPMKQKLKKQYTGQSTSSLKK